MSEFDYKAFITYSHTDTKAASWLARSLESYRVPSRLVGRKTEQGVIARRIGSIFRDREELPASGDLSQSLSSAIARSEYLIVVCSPAARQSRWVDVEISEFKKTHDASKILCFIVAGDPFAANDLSREHLECFPKALEFIESDAQGEVAAEPIAADIREGGDGKRLAKLKIISGLLDLGLDELIQRDSQRRQRNLLYMTLASATGMLAMAMLSFIAIDARNTAIVAQNNEELRRTEAEDLIEFMLSDLRDRLDDVGRLDVLDAVGEKAIEYYSNVELQEHSESALGRRARAFHLLGEVDDLQGDIVGAKDAFDEAYRSTGELLEREPDAGERVYNHAQSVFWVGYLDWRLGNYDLAEPAFREYLELANRLVQLDSNNPDWFAETGHANLNMGVFSLSLGLPTDAIFYFEQGRQVFQSLSEEEPDDIDLLFLLAQANGWLATANEYAGAFSTALDYRVAEVQIYRKLQLRDSSDQAVNTALLVAYYSQGIISLALGEIDIAVDTLFESKEYGDELLSLDPENTFVIQELAAVSRALSHALSFTENPEQATEYIIQAENMVAPLLDRDRGVLEWNVEWYRIQNILSKNLLRSGETNRAITLLTKNIEEMGRMVSTSPGSRDIHECLAEAHFSLAKAFELVGDDARAEQQIALVIEEYSSITGALSPAMKSYLSMAHAIIGNSEQAAELALELAQGGYRHPEYLYYQ